MASATSGSPDPEEEPLTEVQQLDAQIQAARDEIAALQHRRSTLSAHILINPPPFLRNILDSPSRLRPEFNLTPETLTSLRKKHEAQQRSSLRALHRLCTSATTFQTRDPDPAAVDGGYVLGVRIEVFSSETREFLIPYYLLLNRPWREPRGRDEFCLHRHTFPDFVPVKEICRKWLPPLQTLKEGSEVQEEENKQDLQSLTKELRRYIASYHRREDAFASMGRDNSNYVSRITLPDAENMEAKVYLKNGSMTHIRLDAKGRIQKISARDEVGRRLYALEKRLQRMERIEAIKFAEI